MGVGGWLRLLLGGYFHVTVVSLTWAVLVKGGGRGLNASYNAHFEMQLLRSTSCKAVPPPKRGEHEVLAYSEPRVGTRS